MENVAHSEVVLKPRHGKAKEYNVCGHVEKKRNTGAWSPAHSLARIYDGGDYVHALALDCDSSIHTEEYRWYKSIKSANGFDAGLLGHKRTCHCSLLSGSRHINMCASTVC